MNVRTRILVAATLATLATGAVHAQDKAAPAPSGKAALEVVRVTATVESVDQKTRAVVLKDAQGGKHEFIAGPDVRNLAQVSAGDVVTLEHGQATVVKLVKSPNKVRERTVTEASQRAAVGQMPGGVVGREVNVVASVEAIAADKKSVTLRGPQNTMKVAVGDPTMLANVKVGDFVQATYAEAIALKVEKAKK